MVATLNQALLVEENFSPLLLCGPQQPSYPEMAYKLSGKGVDVGGGGEGGGGEGGGSSEGGGAEQVETVPPVPPVRVVAQEQTVAPQQVWKKTLGPRGAVFPKMEQDESLTVPEWT